MMETSQLKASTVTITNPVCQTCSKRYTCNNKTFMNCYVPEQISAGLTNIPVTDLKFELSMEDLVKKICEEENNAKCSFIK